MIGENPNCIKALRALVSWNPQEKHRFACNDSAIS